MTSLLPYIVLQHAYFYGGGVPDPLPVANGSIMIPNFNLQSLDESQPTPTPNLGPRRPDYKYTSSEFWAHKVHAHVHTWNEARVHCQKEGAHLTIINSVAEAEAIVDLLRESDIKDIWIGAHDFFEEGKFVTIHDESLEKAGFNVWYEGEPNNRRSNEHCVVFNLGGKLNDVSCVERRDFICELPYVA